MLALLDQGIKVDKYVAYEIDKYAIKTATHNFPEIEQRGDVFNADFTEFRNYDYLMGGSPCTYWSIAQKNNRETEASGLGWELFSQYVRALREAQPKYFVYENNKSMSNAIRESITNTFGFEPICINSALLSAQNRQRLYWVGKRNDDGTYSKVEIEQPEDQGIRLKDILEYKTINTTDDGEKSRTLMAGYYKYGTATCVAEPVCMRYERSEKAKKIRKQYESGKIHHGFHELSELHPRTDGKSNTISTVLKDNPICEPVCAAQRGRYSDTGNRSSKGSGKVEQYYEARSDGKTNALTTVQKDNQICEPVRVGSLPHAFPLKVGEVNGGGQGNRIYSVEGKAVSQTANSGGIGSNTGLYAVPVESRTLEKAIPEIANKFGYLPEMFNAYNRAEIKDKAPTLSTGSMVTSSCAVNRFEEICCFAIPTECDENGKPIKAMSCADGKTYQVYEVKNGLITIKGKEYPIKLADGFYIIRKLTVRECMRLQTVPEWYDFSVVSDTQAYKMLGNGWTVAVISYLLRHTIE